MNLPLDHHLPKALSSVSYLHPLVTRIRNNPNFYLEPQPDLQCMYCKRFCSESAPISLPLQRGRIFGQRVNIHIPSDDFGHTVTRTRRIYCDLHCLKTICYRNDVHSLFNDYAKRIYHSKLDPVTELRAALPFWTLIDFGGVLDQTNYQLWKTSGKVKIPLLDHLPKLQNKIDIKKYYPPTFLPTTTTTNTPHRLIQHSTIPYEWLFSKETMYILEPLNLSSLYVLYDFSHEPNIYSAENKLITFLTFLCPFYQYTLEHHPNTTSTSSSFRTTWYQRLIEYDVDREKTLCCWNDYHEIGGEDKIKYPGVLEYDESTRRVTKGSGVFCSPSCNESYCMKLRGSYQQTREVWNHQVLSHYFANDRQIQITPAPPRRILKMFGGIWTIEQYRDAFYKYTVTLHEHPLIKYPIQVQATPEGEESESEEDQQEKKLNLNDLYRIDQNNYQLDGFSGKRSELQKTSNISVSSLEDETLLEETQTPSATVFRYVLHNVIEEEEKEKEKQTEEVRKGGEQIMFDLLTISIQTQ